MNIQKFEKRIKLISCLKIKQNYEIGEVLLGFEGKNKYAISDGQNEIFATAEEYSWGLASWIFRQIFRYWRSFEIHIKDLEGNLLYILKCPFRFFFKTLYLTNVSGESLGHIQQRFAILSKKFDIMNERGRRIGTIRSPLLKIWTFEVKSRGRTVGEIQKKWSGALSELFTDKDNFIINFSDSGLDHEERILILATSLLIDIVYFENNYSGR